MSARSPYDRGPWKVSDAPKMLIGAAVIAGGIYGLVRLMLGAKESQAAAATPANRASQLEPGPLPPSPARRGQRWGG